MKGGSDMFFKDITIVNSDFEIEEHVNIAITGDIITYIGKDIPQGDHGMTISGRNRVVIPGFVNAHGHSPMSLMRGYGENLSLHDWLFTRIFPFEDKLTADAVYGSTMLGMAESFKYGIVSTSDMYYFMDDMIRAYSESGAKGNISRGISNMAGEPFAQLVSARESVEAIERYNGAENGRIRIDASLHAEYTNDEQTARGIAEVAKKHGVGMHVHVSETKAEHEECIERRGGRTPVKFLADCGLFDVPALAAHCVWIDDADREILESKKVTVVTNPVSNLKLASGICDVPALTDMGINVAIGTDSVASNNNLSMFEEMKTMMLLAKVKSEDPTVITPKQALYMATRGGAKAQGRRDCGAIKTGNKADLVVLGTDSPNMQPCHDLMNNIVLSATDSDILMTIIDGRIVYDFGEFPTIDVEKIAYETGHSVRDILSKL